MTRTRTLGEFLKTSGFVTAPAEEPVVEKKKEAAVATPAPATPAPAAAAPAPTAAPEKKEAATEQPAQVYYDPALIKTAEQKWCLEQGMLITDPAKAKAIYDSTVKTAEAQKKAEQQKYAAELEARGRIMYHGMMKEAAAFQLALGEIDLKGAVKAAAMLKCDANEIIAAAREMKTAADAAEAAVANDVFFSGALGSAARPGASGTQQAAAESKATVEFQPGIPASAGPAHGPDAKTMRFTEASTLPGNPGLNHGQPVDQGKGL